jgi:hypothetical protein
MKSKNTHTTRESWLCSATDELRPYFNKLGYKIPDKIRFAIAFTSTGKRGSMPGECWHPVASADQHYEIIIRADMAEPVEVLTVLVHELVHTLLPPEAKHGKAFRDIALRVGLTGPMRQTSPTQILAERLQAIATNLGPLPHARLNFSGASDVPKKQAKKWFKAECSASCGYSVRITAKWAKVGMPICPVSADHGPLICDMPHDCDDTTTDTSRN